MYEGMGLGGPLDGKPIISRFPKGVLLVDKQANECWVYEYDPDSQTFAVRPGGPMPVQTEGPINRCRAAEEPSYDVLAAPWIGGGSDDPSA